MGNEPQKSGAAAPAVSPPPVLAPTSPIRPSWWPLLAALALGAGLRAACLSAELWLDEIWSWSLARQAGSPWRALAVPHDNNHPLNSLYLLAIPDGAPLWAYRLHALLAGVATIAAGWRAAARFGPAAAGLTALLLAGSSWLVLASAEARGYALALLFALVAFDALWASLAGGGWPARGVFWAASVLGFLSHLTFALAYLAFVVWSLRRFAARRARPGDELRELLSCHAGPAVFFVGYYLLVLRGLEVGGGPAVGVASVVWRLLSQGLGAPPGVGWLGVIAVGMAAALAASGLRLAAARGDVWVFFAAAVVAAPVLFVARRPPVLYERYLFVPYLFLLVLLGVGLGGLWEKGRAGQASAVVLVAVFLAGNIAEVLRYVRAGRGRFQEALAHIVEQSAGGPIPVAGDIDLDRDFRTRTYLDFYGPRAAGAAVEYRRDGPVEWIILHRLEPWLDGRPAPGGEVTHGGARYRLDWASPPRGLAWGWYVYRRAAPRPGAG